MALSELKPFWSVMIPIYNARWDYLEQALRSVIDQAPGSEQMQIEIIDDCSPKGVPVEQIEKLAPGRITVHIEPRNLGLAGAWNRCIERAQGQWVHILHQDDYVLPGFYQKLSTAAQRHPTAALIAARSFFVDEESIITAVSQRLQNLEKCSREVSDFFYLTPLQCPGIAVKRSFYAAEGNFRTDLCYTLDCEMWTRAISRAGGVVLPEVLACYRVSSGNETGRLTRTAEALRDLDRLHQLFMERYPHFNLQKARRRNCDMAIERAERFAQTGDAEAAKANLEYWKQNAQLTHRLRRSAKKLIRTFMS